MLHNGEEAVTGGPKHEAQHWPCRLQGTPLMAHKRQLAVPEQDFPWSTAAQPGLCMQKGWQCVKQAAGRHVAIAACNREVQLSRHPDMLGYAGGSSCLCSSAVAFSVCAHSGFQDKLGYAHNSLCDCTPLPVSNCPIQSTAVL